jgi:hypothetical protein
MFCTVGHVSGGAEGVGSRFHVLRYRTHFRQYRGRRVPFSCFAHPDSFSAVPWASAPVFKFCAPELIFDGTEGRRVPFSGFALPDKFLAVQRASGPVFIFYSLGLVFGGTEGVRSRFHVLSVRTRFLQYRGRPLPLSCFARPDSFSAVPRVSGPVFMFCTPGLIFGGTKGVGSRFHGLRSRTRFRRYRGRRVTFSCIARPDSFSALPRASSLVFMFCTLGLIFIGTEGVDSRFHVLRSRTHFRRYRVCRVMFSSFARPDSFSTVPRASGPVFMFCTPGHIFGGADGVGSSFHVLRS